MTPVDLEVKQRTCICAHTRTIIQGLTHTPAHTSRGQTITYIALSCVECQLVKLACSTSCFCTGSPLPRHLHLCTSLCQKAVVRKVEDQVGEKKIHKRSTIFPLQFLEGFLFCLKKKKCSSLVCYAWLEEITNFL